jgi:5'-3' exonuclease
MIIIDYSQVAISTLMAELAGRTDVPIEKDLVRHMIINNIRSYKSKFKEEYGDLVIACDNRHYWRKDKFPYYKANRKKVRQESGFDWKLIFDIISEVKSELDCYFPYPVIDVDGAEADDVIAVLVERMHDKEQILIISGDHDFIQLQSYPEVKQYSPIQKKFIKADKKIVHILMEHIIKGDKGDGVPNILSPDDIFMVEGRQKPITSKKLDGWINIDPDAFHMNVDEETARNFQRNRYLVDFQYIPDQVKANIDNVWNNRPKKDRSNILNYFIEKKMKNLIEHVGEF